MYERDVERGSAASGSPHRPTLAAIGKRIDRVLSHFPMSEGWPGGFQTARIEGAPPIVLKSNGFLRAHSASTKDYLATPLSPLHLFLAPPYNIFSQA